MLGQTAASLAIPYLLPNAILSPKGLLSLSEMNDGKSAAMWDADYRELRKSFLSPPAYAKPQNWWHWMNNNITKVGITADLEAMHRVGIGGATIVNADCGIPPGPVEYMSPAWQEMVHHAVKESARLGLDLCLENCAGWSSSGGPWNTPDHAMQKVVFTETKVSGTQSYSGNLPQPETIWKSYHDIAVLALLEPDETPAKISDIRGKAAYVRSDTPAPDPDTTVGGVYAFDGIFDVSDRMNADGEFSWNVPDGDWTILRVGFTPTGVTNHPAPKQGIGPECDKLSAEAMQAHWDGMLAKVIKDIGKLTSTGLTSTLIDSYEVGSQNWTPKFREEFRKRRGYDLLKYLPTFTGRVVENNEISDRFLNDLRLTICELFTENYAGKLDELCHEHGMHLMVEPYGDGTFEDIGYGGKADIPMGEFWTGGSAAGSPKLAAAVGHVYGHQIIGAEAFTAAEKQGRWIGNPATMKALGDQAYCMGINRFVFHRYAHQPWMNRVPGMTMGPWGFMFERTVTWWDQGSAWLDYLARCQYMLQQGKFVADALYYVGENEPVSLRVGDPALPDGYDYDGCNRDILLNRMEVFGGRIALKDGMDYALLILPPDRTMSPEVMRKIKLLVSNGATVVGPKPLKSPSLQNYPQCDDEVRNMADEVWGDCDGQTVTKHRYGNGRVIWGEKLEDVFNDMQLPPDFETGKPLGNISWIHRRTDSADYYFVANAANFSVTVNCHFRVSGRPVELWCAESGLQQPAPVYKQERQRTNVTLILPATGSIFVVFPNTQEDHLHLEGVTWSSATLGGSAKAIPELVITKAIYEAQDGAGSADVTKIVQGLIVNNTLTFSADNATLGGDPTPLHVKQLSLDYSYGGKPEHLLVPENTIVSLPASASGLLPPYTLQVDPKKGVQAYFFEPGTLEMNSIFGEKRYAKAVSLPKAVEIEGPWELKFPPNLGAPDQVTLSKLISWTKHDNDGVRYFSGTATYLKDFEAPEQLFGEGKEIVLDLGDIKNLAQIVINGKNLGILWKPPFSLNATHFLHPGTNHLEISVTNLWINRLIGDDHLPEDCEWEGQQLKEWPQWFLEGKPSPTGRITFTTWKHWTKKDEPFESGLMGPVVLRPVIMKAISNV